MSGLCMMKLDVMDGMECVQLGVGYTINGVACDILPFGAELLAQCQPVYEEMPGWERKHRGRDALRQAAAAAQNYLNRMQEVCGVPIDIISTGPDREQTIVRRHPFVD
jgi:adenylosuccinate synthase